MPGIGLLNEKPLHAALKEWCAQPEDQFEVPVDGYVIDILQGDLLVEIQTSSFASIKTKLLQLARTHPVRLVYPVAVEKWILKLPESDSGEVTRRKSPRRGRVEDLFWELVSFPQLIAHPNFTLEVVFIREEELRRHDSRRAFRRRGWVIQEHRLLEVTGRWLFEGRADWLALLPDGLHEPYTTLDLAETLGISRRLAGKMIYCLRQAKLIRPVGKRGRAPLYGVAEP